MASLARAGGAVVPVLFASAVLLSAALLFAVQPMFARMVLPLMGGTPATWTTCLLFFQAALLVGYLYVHVSVTRLAAPMQAAVHVSLLAAAVVLVPLAAPPAAMPEGDGPAWWLLRTLTRSVGLPFVAAAATAPLLQRWYARVSGQDPYFLYAASNVGSLAGLLGYPLIVERTLALAGQRAAWSVGFAALAVLITACAAVTRRHVEARDALWAAPAPTSAPVPPGTADRGWWLLLALVPSSLLLGVTTHISTDVAAAPLLWVAPLALYLMTFVIAFAPRTAAAFRRWTARLAPVAIVAALVELAVGTSWWIGLPVHLTAFVAIALAFHVALADRRPPTDHLTQYFVVISVGGALGGVVNAVVAPSVFTQVAEYPLMLAAAAALRPPPAWRGGREEPLALVVGVPLVVFAVLAAVWSAGIASGSGAGVNTIGFWVVAAVTLAATNRRAAFGTAVTLAAVAHLAVPRSSTGQVIFAARSFFGVHRVLEDGMRTRHRLMHGTTLHGWERLDSDGCDPTSYYHPDGPMGQLFRSGHLGAADVAVIGLGAGGLSCYAPAGSRWTFLEIDPLVERIARTPSLFTFLARAAGRVEVTIGDGRLSLAARPAGVLDTVVVDAFSSDAIPVHLLTREFVAMALARVKPDGHVVFHISNRYLDLGPVLAAAAASVGAQAVEQHYTATDADALSSRWVVVGTTAALLPLAADGRWRSPNPAPEPWTDDFSNILDVVAWPPSRTSAPPAP